MKKINIGCGGTPLKNYINIDQDNLSSLKKRYPFKEFPKNVIIKNYNIFKLPFADSSIDEVRADGLIEHLSFIEEPKFFYEIKRVLKPKGKICLITVDFEKTVKQWLKAKDEWKNFFKNSKKAISETHWFGTYSYNFKNKWGYLTASIYGSQNGRGQFHKNCYSEKKLKSICKKLNFKVDYIKKKRWKKNRDYTLELRASKIS